MSATIRPNDWSVEHRPAAATQATISKAAQVGFKHIITSITACIAAVGTASGVVVAVLRDSTTGAGNVLWSGVMSVPVAGSQNLVLSDLRIEGVKSQAVTLEFTGAGAAATVESVAMTGYTEQA